MGPRAPQVKFYYGIFSPPMRLQGLNCKLLRKILGSPGIPKMDAKIDSKIDPKRDLKWCPVWCGGRLGWSKVWLLTGLVDNALVG